MKKRKPFEWLLDFVEVPGGIFGACLMESTALLRIKVEPGNEIAGFLIAASFGWLLAWLIDRRKPVQSDGENAARRRNWPPRFAMAAIIATLVNAVIAVAPELVKRVAL